ncbi:Glutamate synthase [NADPH] large chain [Myxococcus hansupus]|uniref:Glutamate synthase [NADPH] large chain n=1 Tax=Pseudomyxococcus hansupus TaxID=1297742 RepID=A0A0H4WXM1_9BACT|nr:outer membrane exchange protein TraA family protein [Myxococcus hansupus]AKQ66085.1 Glutamate synthase [NADPH] large chain [Myxococcus hansupus]
MFLLLVWGLLIPLAAGAQVVVISGRPVAPLPGTPGVGLCSAARVSRSPAADFPQSQWAYIPGINAFLDADPGSRIDSVVQTPLDLSNNLNDGRTLSYGDFQGAVAGCPAGGCGFIYNDDLTSFATRLRGYLAVTSDMAGRSLQFGFYADESVSLTIIDGNQAHHPLINRPPTIGFPTWRAAKTVRFEQPGLYGVEVLYTNIGQHAALELSLRDGDGDLADFERQATTPPIIRLDAAGFVLMTPELFHQTESGWPSFPVSTECAQCNRQSANAPGNGGCEAGFRCNAAALCARCDSLNACGESCSPCGASAPYCVSQAEGFACAECRGDNDCWVTEECRVPTCSETGRCASNLAEDGTACRGGTCQQGECMRVDAGTPDAGEVDGGAHPDEDGGSANEDGGTSDDDGGSADEDGGSSAEEDGGSANADGGSTVDSGVPGGDAGAVDGGAEAPPASEAGCGCQGGPSALFPTSLLVLARVVRRGRR